MKNSTKKTMSVLSSIGAIILGNLQIISSIYYMALISESPYSSFIVFYFIDFVLGVMLLIFACMTFTEKGRFNLPLSITILTILALLLVSQIYNMIKNFTDVQIVGLLIISFSLIVKILEMCIKDSNFTKNQNSQLSINDYNDSISTYENNLTVDQKIKELKHLKDLGILESEQYEKALKKIIDDVK